MDIDFEPPKVTDNDDCGRMCVMFDYVGRPVSVTWCAYRNIECSHIGNNSMCPYYVKYTNA